MRSRTAALLAFLVLLLSACSGGGSPTVLPPLPSLTATATASPTASPMVVSVPAAARKHDAFGASAFVKFWFAQLDQAYRSGGVFPVAALSDSRCKSCSNFAAAAAYFRGRDHHVRGATFENLLAEASLPGPGLAYVSVTASLPKRLEVDSHNRVVKVFPPDGRLDLVVVLSTTTQGWVVRAMRSDP